MLIVNKTYRIVDDENDTVINIEKDNNSYYHWKVKTLTEMGLGSFLLTSICLIFLRLLRIWLILFKVDKYKNLVAKEGLEKNE